MCATSSSPSATRSASSRSGTSPRSCFRAPIRTSGWPRSASPSRHPLRPGSAEVTRVSSGTARSRPDEPRHHRHHSRPPSHPRRAKVKQSGHRARWRMSQLATVDRRAATWGVLAVLVALAIAVLGSGNLRWFDAALVGYLFGTLFAIFAVVYRYLIWLRRPPTARLNRRGGGGVLPPGGA